MAVKDLLLSGFKPRLLKIELSKGVVLWLNLLIRINRFAFTSQQWENMWNTHFKGDGGEGRGVELVLKDWKIVTMFEGKIWVESWATPCSELLDKVWRWRVLSEIWKWTMPLPSISTY